VSPSRARQNSVARRRRGAKRRRNATRSRLERYSTALLRSSANLLQIALEQQETPHVWKTSKAWSGSCRELTVALIDGTSHTARFRLK
jgi:hypothetical protein